MTDDIERMARAIETGTQSADAYGAEVLARALIAVLPVVRAAEAWDTRFRQCENWGDSDMSDADARLRAAVSTLRERMKEGSR